MYPQKYYPNKTENIFYLKINARILSEGTIFKIVAKNLL